MVAAEPPSVVRRWSGVKLRTKELQLIGTKVSPTTFRSTENATPNARVHPSECSLCCPHCCLGEEPVGRVFYPAILPRLAVRRFVIWEKLPLTCLSFPPDSMFSISLARCRTPYQWFRVHRWPCRRWSRKTGRQFAGHWTPGLPIGEQAQAVAPVGVWCCCWLWRDQVDRLESRSLSAVGQSCRQELAGVRNPELPPA